MTKDRDEDSGLHDIRSLASSTKARLSSRRSTQNPVMNEDDILASSSAGWKAVALPEPAKMISLPELAELPTQKEIKAKEKAAKKEKVVEAKAAPIATAAPSVSEAAPVASSSIPNIGARIAAKKASGGGKGKTIALVGMGLAAAAGVTLFFMMKNKDAATSADSSQTVAAGAPSEEYKSQTKMLPPPPPPAAVPETAAAGSAAPADPPMQIAAAAEEPAPAKAAPKNEKPGKVHKVEVRDTSMTDKGKDEPKVVPKKDDKEKAKGGEGEGEPSFDALLKEAGVSDAKKEAKPKLDKKSLSGSDIKSGMGAVAGKATGCYAGTQGQANVKLTVAPSGQVQKVSVSGVFAGTPVASCVEAAVKSTSFPAWDGGPQTFSYSYLLAE